MQMERELGATTRSRLRPHPPSCKFCGIIRGHVDLYESNPLIETEREIPYESTEFVAFPDAAPIGRGHFMIVPREHVLSVGRLDQRIRQHVIDTAEQLIDAIGTRFSELEPYCFEHGSSEGDETIGCSITHAHFHVFFAEVGLLTEFEWNEVYDEFDGIMDAWRRFGRHDYYLLGKFNDPIYGHEILEDPELKCNQFLRKIVSEKLGHPELSDYRRYEDSNEKDELFPTIESTHELLERASTVT